MSSVLFNRVIKFVVVIV